MKAYQIISGSSINGLTLRELAQPNLGPHDVRIRIGAVALNYRDLMIADGSYQTGNPLPVIPASDAAGEVIETGNEVRRFQPGDRVMISFYPDWIDGRPTPATTVATFGADTDGVLAEQIVVNEAAAVAIPAHLSYAEAATIPCAAVTAWNALFNGRQLHPGDDVLVLGTGGVSIWGLQLGVAAGLRVIVTSSSEAKLAKARALGAYETINYTTSPNWHDEVRRITKGKGVELIIEVGGAKTLKASVAAAAMAGQIVVVGGMSGFGGELEPFGLIRGQKTLAGISVGSRAMLEATNKLIANAMIRPAIDRIFGFSQAAEAFRHLARAEHIGKVVIDVAQ